MSALKQVVGIDVAKDELVASFGKLMEDLSTEIKDYKVFSNSEKALNHFLNGCTAKRHLI